MAYRKTAVVVGLLFIGAIVMLFVGEAFYRPIIDEPDYLQTAFPERQSVIAGILLEYTSAPAVVAIALLLYPLLKKHSEVLALGYLGFRVMEMSILSVAYVSTLSLVSVSDAYLSSGGVDTSSYQAVGNSLAAINDWAGTQGMIYHVIFSLGSMILYTALFKSVLVPRLISIAGIVAAVALLAGSVLGNMNVFGDASDGLVELLFASPIALVEVTLSIWLITKGFNQSAIDQSGIGGAQADAAEQVPGSLQPA